MILSICICSNTSKDEECDKVDQIWREAEQLLRKPIWLEPDQQQARHHLLSLSPGLYVCSSLSLGLYVSSSSLNLFCQLALKQTFWCEK